MCNNSELCVICETIGEDTIATFKFEFNGDSIPVCETHYNMLEEDPGLLNILDEQSI